MASEARTHGFWRGFVAGLVLAAALGLGLAWLYPPRPLMPPEIAPGALEAPAAPGQPEGVAEPDRPGEAGLLPPPAKAPLIEGVPTPGADQAPPAGGTGGASLVPQAKP